MNDVQGRILSGQEGSPGCSAGQRAAKRKGRGRVGRESLSPCCRSVRTNGSQLGSSRAKMVWQRSLQLGRNATCPIVLSHGLVAALKELRWILMTLQTKDVC